MEKIEKLIIKAKKNVGLGKPQLNSAIVDYDNKKNKYIARGFVAGGGKDEMWSHPCDTVQQAVELIQNLSSKFPNAKELMIALCWEAFEEWRVIRWQEENH